MECISQGRDTVKSKVNIPLTKMSIKVLARNLRAISSVDYALNLGVRPSVWDWAIASFPGLLSQVLLPQL